MKKLLWNAPGRCLRSLGYCWNGLKDTFGDEESFRLECLAFAVLLACLVLSPWPLWKCLAQTGCFLLIPLAEVINSAIEDVCDGITRERTAFIRKAKDKGALAVLLAIAVNLVVLAALLAA